MRPVYHAWTQLFGAAALTIGAAGPAWSQAPEVEGNAIDEVVVTARKREENLQDVPLAVQAITAEQIEAAGIKGVEQVIETDPSLNFDTGFAPYDTRIVIRGISPTRGRPNVATLVDGIDVSSESIGVAGGSLLINPKLLDIERIEVVKGPQSALYGRSAFAGAIQYVTKDPSTEPTVSVGAEFAQRNHTEVRGDFSAPLIEDRLGVRVTGLRYEKQGAYRNAITGNKVGGSEGLAGALSFKWTPSDSVGVKLRYEYADDDFEQSAQAFMPFNVTNVIPGAASSCATSSFSGLVDPQTGQTFSVSAVPGPIRDASCATVAIQNRVPIAGVAAAFQPAGTALTTFDNGPNILESVTGRSGVWDDTTIPAYRGSLGSANGLRVLLSPDYGASTDGGITAPDFPGSNREVHRIALTANWDVPWGRFSSLTGYTDARVGVAIDLDKFGIPGATRGQDISAIEQNLTTFSKTWQTSQELRFTSDFDFPVNFIAGLQYWKERVSQLEGNYTVIAAGTRCQLNRTSATTFAELAPGTCGGVAGNSIPIASRVTQSTPVGQYIDDVLLTRDTTITDRTIDHQSAYLQIGWQITDTLAISAEARYVDEDNEITGPDPIENPLLGDAPSAAGPGTRTLCGSNGPCTAGPPPLVVPGQPGAAPTIIGQGLPNGLRGFGTVRPVLYRTFERNDSYVTPRFSLDWKAAENALLYASYSIGKKPGGFSTVTIGAFGLESRPDIEFEPEQLKEYELGWKTSWLDRRLILNGALFFEDFTDKQISTQEVRGNTLGNVIRNIGGAEVRGLELAAQWRALDKLTLALNYTYLDSEYTDFETASSGAPEIARVGSCTPVPDVTVVPTAVTQIVAGMAVTSTLNQTQVTARCNVSRTGNRLEDTPEHALAASLTWRDTLSNGLDWFADLAVRHQSRRYLEDDNAVWAESYWVGDVAFGLSGERWSAILYVDNVFDDDTIRSGSSGPANANADFRSGVVIRAGAPLAGVNNVVGGIVQAPLIPTLTFANLPDPRTVGLRLNFKF